MELHALTGEAVAREMAKGVSRQEACCADLAMANARHHANAHYALSHIEPDSCKAPSVPASGHKTAGVSARSLLMDSLHTGTCSQYPAEKTLSVCRRRSGGQA
jgi:hypothetical protein